MTDSTAFSRRRFLSLAAVVAAGTTGLMATQAVAADLPALTADDPLAKSLNYVADASKLTAASAPTFKPGSACAKCSLYSGAAGAANGPCGIFAGKSVSAKGWCVSFAAKA